VIRQRYTRARPSPVRLPVTEARLGTERYVTSVPEERQVLDRDRSRPGIEFYRRHDVVDLLLPVD